MQNKRPHKKTHHIGKLTDINELQLADKYYQMAQADEQAAHLLAQANHFEQASYFLIQAMEKQLRVKIFTRINGNLNHNREINQNHNIENAIETLLKIFVTDEIKKQQFKNFLDEIKGTYYNRLHNNLRYPFFYENPQTFKYLVLEASDYYELNQRLDQLKKYLIDLH